MIHPSREQELGDSMARVVFNLGAPGQRHHLVTLGVGLMEEDPLEEVTLLVNLVGVQQEARHLFKEDARLDLTPQVG